MEKDNQFFSSRRYALRDCVNPNCEFYPQYVPHDKRQKFCCAQCRKNFHNDQRSLEDNTIFIDLKNLKSIDRKLDKIYIKHADQKGYCCVRKEVFYHEGINVMLLVKELRNSVTGKPVKGYFRYGIELSAQDNNFYFIYKLKLS